MIAKHAVLASLRMTYTKLLLGASLAILAETTLAQSSNVMYGTIDVCGIYSTAESNSKRSAIESGCHDASVIGWRIQEAITSNLNVVARLEYGLAVDDNSGIGAPQFGGRAIERQGYVGLSGDFGSLVAGRMSSPVKFLQYFDPVGGNVFSGLIALLPTPINSRADPTHFSNAVRYWSPTIDGWQAMVVYAFAPYVGDSSSYTSDQERAAFISAYYQGEHASFFASNQWTQHVGNISPLTLRDTSAAAAWDFGQVKVSGIYVHSKRSGAAILGGADRRVFDQFSFGFLYRCTEVDHIGIQASRLLEHKRDQADATSMGLIFEHAMSKRTTLYAGYNLTLNEDTTQFSADYFNRPAPGDSATLFGAGVRHNF